MLPEKTIQNEKPIYIEDEIRDSYLDYSMSVIVGRALPDVRDGLKPVHRRVLFAMSELGNTYDKPHKKCARIVGEVLGKYHPHGDSAVYQTMVRMAQDFNYRYTLIDGHGNFGSIDGDSAAAMRYTEARMSKIAEELLVDMDKNTVDFRKNFDETLDEPVVLPAKLPHLLINGSTGIAVGMATNIPPHNLSEVINALIALIDNREISVEELATHVKGPDFPTAGVIYGTRGITEAYHTGRGRLKLRGKAAIEQLKNGKEVIIINEIPYQVNKSKLIEKIAELIRDKKITGVTDLRDESNREGIRIVMEIKKGENSELILNKLYKFTDLEMTFGIIMIALVDNVPRVLNLKEILRNFLKHRFEVVTRRTKFELDKAERRAHILEGLRIAIDHIDEVIAIIRGSKGVEEARNKLIARFSLSEEQAKAIVEMRLRSLTGLERDKIEEEYNQLAILIAELKEILGDENKIYEIIKKESLELQEKYGGKRQTEIVNEEREINYEDLIKDETVLVTITNKGYIKRMTLDQYREQKRGGRGVSAHQMTEEDFIENMYIASNLDTLLIFTNKGKVYNIKVYEIPEASKQARGKLINNLISTSDNESVRDIIKVREFEANKNVFFITAKGIIKKVNLELFKNINKAGIRAINLNDNDDLIFAGISDESKEILIATKNGFSIRFVENETRAMGRAAAGVKGIALRNNDEVVSGMIIESKENKMLTVTENGYAKITDIDEYRPQKRGGMGIINIKPNEKTGKVVQVKDIKESDQIVLISSNGVVIRTNIEEISTVGRGSKGVIVMKVRENEKVTSVVRIRDEETGNDNREGEIEE